MCMQVRLVRAPGPSWSLAQHLQQELGNCQQVPAADQVEAALLFVWREENLHCRRTLCVVLLSFSCSFYFHSGEIFVLF